MAKLFATPASRQRMFVVGLLLFFVGVSIQYSCKVIEKESASAVARWRPQLLLLGEGVDIYRIYSYPNPPIMAMILMPLAQLSSLAGGLCWFYLKVCMTLAAFFWTFRLIESPEQPFPAWAKALAVVLSLRPIMGDLTHGNINLFVLFLVVAALFAFRQGYDIWSGLLLALAIASKVTPALFVPYFVWKRAWKTLAGCAVGLILFFWLVPACYFGHERNQTLLTSWTDQMVKPFVVHGVVFYSELNNQSLPGLVFRLATHSPSFSMYIDGRDYWPVEYHNLVTLEVATARWLIRVCMLLFAALIVYSCRTPTASRQDWRLAAEFGLVLLGMLLFSERTWKHHCVTMLVPMAVLCYYLATQATAWQIRGYLVGSLAAVTLLMASTSTIKLQRWDEFAELAQVYGAYLWASLVLVTALVVLLRRPEPLAVEPRV